MIQKPTFINQDGLLISILPPSDRKPSKKHVRTLGDGTVKIEVPTVATIILQPWDD